MATHHQKVRAVGKRVAKEGDDRVRKGLPRYPGDDRCGDRHDVWTCARESGHGGVHRGWSGTKERTWKKAST